MTYRIVEDDRNHVSVKTDVCLKLAKTRFVAQEDLVTDWAQSILFIEMERLKINVVCVINRK